MQTEVLIGQVTATDDGDAIIDDHGLVVHAVVEPVELGEIQRLPRREAVGASLVRIEYAVFDVWVLGEFEKYVVFAEKEGVVDEQLDGDAAFGGCNEMVQHESPDRVQGPQEGLQVDALGCAVDRSQPPVQRGGTIVEQRKPVARALLGKRFPGIRGCRRRGVLRQLFHGLQRGARSAEDGEKHRQTPRDLPVDVPHGAKCSESV